MKQTVGTVSLAKTRPGFTLIEVVLVLAIGGLIFLLAFLAFGQVNRSRRDSQRRSDAARIIAELQNFHANYGVYPDNVGSAIIENANTLCTATSSPTDFRSFLANYVCTDGSFLTPTGIMYGLANSNNPTVEPPLHRIKYVSDRSCGSSTITPGAVRVWITLESGSAACKDLL